ncbi:DNA methyltransferase [Phorcysia thermohydrogeniphila]|uniref:site-specific DNA-methyltransferase (cytosine-N(4)-specific) n=1 Tax=Phorcysia thermohydrogeniphila TaxID=936138 RepID=A0A4R1GDQ6_9BACT|nr:DNA methyltransferase [Phorcysia thermohydrogeniphila]TCK06487.1 DNA methylase [Phorcysia thermohydrogeniphila]
MEELLSLKEAAQLLSELFNRSISETNISYLINYGRVNGYRRDGKLFVSLRELKEYYEKKQEEERRKYEAYLGKEINWHLSFDWVKESERTKHVHRLHPYKGKFIPQLVEYFLDEHTDEFKREVFFRPGDIVLDPFCGSGTTLIQANELGIHSIGIDVSEFNTIIAEVKFANVDLTELELSVRSILRDLKAYESQEKLTEFEEELKKKLQEFNQRYFPSPEFKKLFRANKVEKSYLKEKEREFLEIYLNLLRKYGVSLESPSQGKFLDRWYLPSVRREAEIVLSRIERVKDEILKKTLMVILSRSVRSARATTHMDLDRLKEPQYVPYYCYKHFKICKPVFRLLPIFQRYAKDTLRRLSEYKKLKTDAFQVVLTGDSRKIDIFEEVKRKNRKFYELLKRQKIKGIFTSPPYVGQIDYHEQHAYAYELFGIERRDELEIGPLFKGEGLEARRSYIEGVSQVLKNCLRYSIDDPYVFIVANDKYNLYPEIARRAGLKIVEEYKRPVLNRTARDKNPYGESVFLMRRIK